MAADSSGPNPSVLPELEYPRHIAIYPGRIRGYRVAVMRWNKREERYEPEREFGPTGMAGAEAKADRLAEALGLEIRKLV